MLTSVLNTTLDSFLWQPWLLWLLLENNPWDGVEVGSAGVVREIFKMLRMRWWTFGAEAAWLLSLLLPCNGANGNNLGLPMPKAYKYLARIRLADASSGSKQGVAVEEELVDVSPERLQHRSNAGKESDDKSCLDDAEHTIFHSLESDFLMDSRFNILVVVVVVD